MEKIYVLEKLYFLSKQKNLDGTIAKELLRLAKKKEKLYLKKVAFHAQCSLSAIAKFVQRKLKLNSFYELKYILKESQEDILTQKNQDWEFQMMLKSFEKLYQKYDSKLINKIIKEVVNFNNIWITAKGDTFTLAFDLAFKFKRLNLSAHTIEAAGEGYVKKNSIKPGDGIILISNKGNTRELISLLNFAKLKNIKCIVFTSQPSSKLAKMEPENCFIIEHYEPKSEGVEILLTAKIYFTYVFDLICKAIIQKSFKNEIV